MAVRLQKRSSKWDPELAFREFACPVKYEVFIRGLTSWPQRSFLVILYKIYYTIGMVEQKGSQDLKFVFSAKEYAKAITFPYDRIIEGTHVAKFTRMDGNNVIISIPEGTKMIGRLVESVVKELNLEVTH